MTTALSSAFMVRHSRGQLLQVGLPGSANAGLESLQPWLHELRPRRQALLIIENAETTGLAKGSEVRLLAALYQTACKLAVHSVAPFQGDAIIAELYHHDPKFSSNQVCANAWP